MTPKKGNNEILSINYQEVNATFKEMFSDPLLNSRVLVNNNNKKQDEFGNFISC